MIKKNLWIRNILSCVETIADLEYQVRAWLRHEIHWPCCYDELMCQLFDDSLVEEFIREKADEYGLSSEQKTTLSELVGALDDYDDTPEIYILGAPFGIGKPWILVDPGWHRIQEMAQRVLDAFGKIKYELEDKEWWAEFIHHAISKYSDVEDQKRMWVDKSELFWSTPLDLYEELFSSCEFDYFMDGYARKLGLSDEQITLLERFRTQLKSTPFKTTKPEGVLDNPDWHKLQKLGREAAKALAVSLERD